MNSPIIYTEALFSEAGCDSAFERLVRDVKWEHRDAPRKEAFFNDLGTSYTYGSGNGIRTYYPQEYVDIVKDIKFHVEQSTGIVFEACFCNYYDGPKDHLGWHADDSDMIDHSKPIAVVSFGSEREIWFRENGTKGIEAIQKLELGNGSLLLMNAGMQQTHQHRIPKHSAGCGPRISLTFRALK